jgi:hypothetical protein
VSGVFPLVAVSFARHGLSAGGADFDFSFADGPPRQLAILGCEHVSNHHHLELDLLRRSLDPLQNTMKLQVVSCAPLVAEELPLISCCGS